MAEQNFELVDARAFLAIEREGSIRAAAKALDVPLNTLRYRLKRLEERAGASLFRRSRNGVCPTRAGVQMHDVACGLIEAAEGSPREPDDMLRKDGQLTISCGEGIGSVWLTPMLGTLQSLLPQLTIGLHCDYDLSRDHSEIADIGITYFDPDDQELIRSRLGTLHFLCYASPDYLRRHGSPRTPEDLRNHRFIEQDAPGTNPKLREHLIGQIGTEQFIRLRTNSSLSVYYAVMSGGGLAFMPSYISHLTNRIQPVDLNLRLRFDMQYYYRRAARNSPVVRTAIDWLKGAFDPRVYPYFADEFVHPNDCGSGDASRRVLPLFPSMRE